MTPDSLNTVGFRVEPLPWERPTGPWLSSSRPGPRYGAAILHIEVDGVDLRRWMAEARLAAGKTVRLDDADSLWLESEDAPYFGWLLGQRGDRMWRPLDDDRLALLSRERIPSDGEICAGRISLDDAHTTWDGVAQFFAPRRSGPRAAFGPFRFDVAGYTAAVEAARELFEAIVLDPDRIERDESRAWLNDAFRRLRVVEGLLWAYDHADFVRETDPNETDPVLRARAFRRLVMASELRAEPVAEILAAFVDDDPAPDRAKLKAERTRLRDEIARRVPLVSNGAQVQIDRHGHCGVIGDLMK